MQRKVYYTLAVGAVSLAVVFALISDRVDVNAAELSEVTYQPIEPVPFERMAKRTPTNPNAAAKLRFDQTFDPATGTVPRERLWPVLESNTQFLRDHPANRVLGSIAERGPATIGGRTRAVVWDPDTANKVWAGSVSGGLWFTTDITTDGTSWTLVDDFMANLAITAMAYDPTTSGATRAYYVGTGEGVFNFDSVRGAGIFKSTDAGVSFNQLASTNNSTFHYVQKVVVTGTGTVLAATRSGVQRSTNGGTSWTDVLSTSAGPPAVTDAANDLEIDANGDIYAGMGLIFSACDGVYKSTNDGVTWTKVTLPGACDYQRVEVATAPSTATTVYVATQSGTTQAVNHVFRSTDSGASFTSLSAPAAGTQAWYDMILAVDPDDATELYLGGVTLWRSSDSGGSWTTISGLHVDHHAIAYEDAIGGGSSNEIVFGNDGGVYYSGDATAFSGGPDSPLAPTIVDRNDDYNVTQYFGGDLHPTLTNVMLAGSQDNSTQRFSSAGIGATTSPSPLNCCDGGPAYFDQTNGNIAVGSIQNAVYFRSTNAGVSFSGSAFLNNGGLFINPGDYDDTNNIFYATRTTTDYSICHNMETTPSCSVSSAVSGQNDDASAWKVSPFAPANTSVVYFGTQNGELFRVSTPLVAGVPTGAATTCQFTNPGPTANISSIDIGTTEAQLLVTYSNFGVNSVYESLNATGVCGGTWNDRDDNSTLPDIPINWGLYDPSDTTTVLLASEAGLYFTNNITGAGPAWTFSTAGVPAVRVDQLVHRPSDGLVMVVTHGRGVWSGQLMDLVPVELTTFEVD